MEPHPQDEEPPPLEGQDPPTGNNVEMQDDTPKGQWAAKEPLVEPAPSPKEDEELLSEEEMPSDTSYQ